MQRAAAHSEIERSDINDNRRGNDPGWSLRHHRVEGNFRARKKREMGARRESRLREYRRHSEFVNRRVLAVELNRSAAASRLGSANRWMGLVLDHHRHHFHSDQSLRVLESEKPYRRLEGVSDCEKDVAHAIFATGNTTCYLATTVFGALIGVYIILGTLL